MALLWVEGFESLGTNTGNAPEPSGVIVDKYADVVNEAGMRNNTGRSGGIGLKQTSSTCRFRTPGDLTTNATLIIGVAVKFTSGDNSAGHFIQLNSGTAWGMNLYYDGAGLIFVRLAATELGTLAASIHVNRWYWIEWKVFTNNTTGTSEVRIGGHTVSNLTGIDTQPAGSAYHSRVYLRGCDGTSGPVYDDLYVCDGSGADNNDFLGGCSVETIRPDGDSSVAWAPLGAGSNYVEVDEVVYDANTSYVSSSTANQVDLYTTANLSGLASTIYGLHISTVARLNVGGSETFITTVSSGGTRANTSNLTVSSTADDHFNQIEELDPNTASAWTVSAVNSALSGIEYI